MKSSTTPRFSVSIKGITLVCLPLLFQLIFVLTLSGLVRQAESDAAAALRSARLIEIGHRLIELSFAAAGGTEGYIFTRHPLYKDMFKQACDEFGTTLSEFAAAPSSKPEQRLAKDRILDLSEKYLTMVKKDMSLSDSNDTEALRGIRNSLSGELLRMLQNRVEDFLGEEEEIRQQEYQAQAKSRHRLNELIYIGVGFNILLAVLMTVFFGSSITKRLRVTIDNTARLKSGRPLHPAVGGSDEIAQLDYVFHDMADSLRSAERVKLDFVAMVSHDLRTPLNAIQLFLESLEAGLFGRISEQGMKHAAQAQRNAKRLIDLIKDLLDLERLESGNFELKLRAVQICDVVHTAIDNVVSDAASRNITVMNNCRDATVMAEPERIVQVLNNLLANAIKFSPDGSEIVVSSMPTGDEIEVSITDHGRGIPTEQQQEIFQRFKQMQPAGEKARDGSGLGLAICKSLVEKHGGTIGVESQIEKGSRFWFRLPVRDKANAAGNISEQVTAMILMLISVGFLASGCTFHAGWKPSLQSAPVRTAHQLVQSEKARQYLDQARSELAGKAFKQAEESASASIDLDPSNHLAYLYRGYAHFKQGDATPAIADFTTAATLQPTDHQCFEYRASAYQSIRRYRRALEDYRKALELAGSNPAVRAKLYKEIGMCNLSFGQLDEAQQMFSKAIEFDPKDSTLYAARAIAELHLAAPQQCIEDATVAIRLDPHNASAFYARSHAYGALRQNDLSDADAAAAKKLFAQSYPVTAQ